MVEYRDPAVRRLRTSARSKGRTMTARGPFKRRHAERSTLGRVLDAERRLGPVANQRAVRIYKWLFLAIGPVGVAFGCYAIWRGFWIGVLLVIIAGWWTISGYSRLGGRRKPQEPRIGAAGGGQDRGAAPQSRPVRIVGGGFLVLLGVGVIVFSFVR
jgi:hypothetical protein